MDKEVNKTLAILTILCGCFFYWVSQLLISKEIKNEKRI